MSPKKGPQSPAFWGTLLSFLILSFWAAPSTWWKDGGQLVSAAYGVGIPHPSGFPTYTLLAKLASFLPLGPIDFRIHLLSALCGALTIGFACALIPLRYGRQRWAAAIPMTFCLLSAPIFALHATTAEVYAPTALSLVALLFFACREENNLIRRFSTVGLITGIGLGCHFSSFLVTAAPLWALLLFFESQKRRWKLPWRPLLWGLGMAAIASLAYLYLPLATRHDPWRNWGSPDSFVRLWDHVTATSIRHAFSDDMLSFSPIRIRENMGNHAEMLWESTGLLAVFAPPLVLFGAFRSPTLRPLSAMVLSIFAMDGLFTIFINPMGILDRQTGLPSVLCLAIMTGVSLVIIQREFEVKNEKRSVFVLALFLCGAASPLLGSASERTLDRSNAGFSERYTSAMTRFLPPNATLLVANDDNLGLLTGTLGVNGSRPDLRLIALPHLYDLHEIQHMNRLYGESVVPQERLDAMKPRASSRGWISTKDQLDWVHFWMQSVEPLFWGSGEPVFDGRIAPFLGSGFPLAQVFPHAKIGSGPSAQRVHQILSNWTLYEKNEPDTITVQVLSEQVRLSGRIATGKDDWAEAEKLFTLSIDLTPGSSRSWSDLAVARGKNGNSAGAASASKVALELKPDRAAPRFRLLESLFYEEKYSEVLVHLSVLEELSPPSAALNIARHFGARAHLEKGRALEAQWVLAMILQDNPGDRKALKLLESLRKKSEKNAPEE